MNEDFRKTPPKALSPKPFNITTPFETMLDNGLRVVVFRDSRVPLVNFRLAFQSGEINDPRDSKGLTSAFVSLLTQGTNTMTSKQIAEEVENLGASLHASSSMDNVIISASALTMYRRQILNLMADITFNPIFPESELNLYKQNTIKNLEFQRSQADFLADEQISKVIYGEHPYAIISPSVSNVENITRDGLVATHKKTLIPNNAIFIAVGDVEPDDLVEELKELFGNWEKAEIPKHHFPGPTEQNKRSLILVDRTGSAQANIVLSNIAINRTHPDYFYVLVMNQILGAGASSRIFMNLREEKGYTYGAYSSFDMRRMAGAFEATTEVRTAVTGNSLRELFYELDKIRTEPVSREELQDAKNFLTGVFPIRAETQEGLTNLIVTQKLYGLPDDYLQTYRDKINAVTIQDVQKVAQKHITPDRVGIVIVGDAEEIFKQAREYADSVEVYDVNGASKDISLYEKASDQPMAQVGGKWSLNVDAQGQQVPVSLILNQENDSLTGSLDSPFGSGTVEEGHVRGSKLTASIDLDFQGQAVTLSLTAKLNEEGTLTGSLSTESVGMPDLSFEGRRN